MPPGRPVLPEHPLSGDFFARPVLEVAPDLLGTLLTHRSPDGPVTVRLTEVEAYAGTDDPGSHAYRGPTPRTQVMFGPPGRVYVYFTYGMHWCINLVCGPTGEASAVLLRAGEVVERHDLATSRRTSSKSPRDLARGPARLTTALGIDGSLDGLDLLAPSSPLSLQLPTRSDAVVRSGPRVGVSGAGAERPWRFWLDGEPTVSPYRAAVLRRPSPPSSGTLGT